MMTIAASDSAITAAGVSAAVSFLGISGSAASFVLRSTLHLRYFEDGTGLRKSVASMSSPLETPPSMPPAVLVLLLKKGAAPAASSSWAFDPGRLMARSTSPIRTPLTEGMLMKWNASLASSEKGFYAMAYLLSLFGSVAVQKNVRDIALHDKDSAGFPEAFGPLEG